MPLYKTTVLGFFVHALFTPDLFYHGVNFKEKNNILGENTTNIPDSKETNKPLTTVIFKDGSFHPKKVIVPKGRYLAIRNESETEQMWLLSEIQTLSTIRGYALSEQVMMRMDVAGTYTVYEKNYQEELIIIVN